MKRIKRIMAVLLSATAMCAVASVTASASEPTNTPVDRSFTFDASMQGKGFVFYGDSITEQLYLSARDKGYIDLLRDDYGFYSYNAGSCSATYSVMAGNTNNLFTQIENSKILLREASYVSLFLGTNDFGLGRELGKANDTSEGTVYGAIRLALDTILQINPDVKIMLIQPLYRADGTYSGYGSANSKGYTLGDVHDAIATVGQEYGCKIVNMQSVVTAQNAAQLLISDQLHVTPSGYRAIYEQIKK